MKLLASILLAGLLVLGWAPRPSQAQETGSVAGLSLDSLLNMQVSTAAKYDQKQTEAPAFVTIITREEIRRFGYRTLDEVLRSQAGFYSGNDREYSDVGARGFGRPGYWNNKILLLVDGHSLNDAFSGGTRLGSAMAVDLDAVERIEIVRGPGSSVYGARAMLAVVNLVTRKGRDLDGVEVIGELGTLEAKGASVQYGRVFSTDSDLAVSASWASHEGEDIYFPEFNAPALNHGVAEGLDWERYVRGLVTFRKGYLSLQGGMSNREKGIPSGAYRTAFNHPDAESRDRIIFAEASYDRELGSVAELTVRGYADSYENDGVFPLALSEGGGQAFDSLRVVTKVDVRSFGSEARVRWDPALNNRLVLGVEGQRIAEADHILLGTSGGDPTGNHPYTILSAFVHDEFQITQDLALTLGIRRDEYSSWGGATTPRGALVYHPNSTTTFKLLAGEAFRAPNLLEMYVNQPGSSLLSNPDLEPEKVRSFEVVWEQRLGPVATTVTAYHNEVRDLIDLVEIQAPDSLAHWGRLIFEQQNIANARSMGFEVEARTVLPLGILAKGSYGFADATDQATAEPLVNSARHLFRLSASGGWDELGELGLNLRAESGRRTLYGTDTEFNAVMDFTATTLSYRDRLRIQLIVKNLLDTEYSAPGGFQHVQSAIPQPGRTVMLRADIRW